MRLICYLTSNVQLKIVPATPTRSWMEQTNRGAYRCLPINIANSHGWFMLNSLPFRASWNGESSTDGVSVVPCGTEGSPLARSHFGSGILTFRIDALFRTEPGYDLLVTGPSNHFKDAIQPLSGIVETDWAQFTFTMNWKFTRRFTSITFERDEPFCMIFPLKRGLLEEVEPEIRSIEENPELQKSYDALARSRAAFNEDLKTPGSRARAQGWQKDYFRGETKDGPPPSDHRTAIKLKEFRVK